MKPLLLVQPLLIRAVIPTRVVTPVSIGRQNPGQTELQVRVDVGAQLRFRAVFRVGQDGLHCGFSEVEIAIGHRGLFGGAKGGVGEVRVQVLPVRKISQ